MRVHVIFPGSLEIRHYPRGKMKGLWLCFYEPDGRQALVNLSGYAGKGSIVQRTIDDWAKRFAKGELPG
jgi:hypothetical protein